MNLNLHIADWFFCLCQSQFSVLAFTASDCRPRVWCQRSFRERQRTAFSNYYYSTSLLLFLTFQSIVKRRVCRDNSKRWSYIENWLIFIICQNQNLHNLNSFLIPLKRYHWNFMNAFFFTLGLCEKPLPSLAVLRGRKACALRALCARPHLPAHRRSRIRKQFSVAHWDSCQQNIRLTSVKTTTTTQLLTGGDLVSKMFHLTSAKPDW